MLYWMIWLALGVAFVIASTSALPIIFVRLRRLATAQTFVKNLLWLGLFVAVASADVFVLCWTATTFFVQKSANFTFNAASGRVFILPLIAAASVLVVGFITGAVLLRLAKRTSQTDPKRTRKREGQNIFSVIQIAALIIAVSFSAIILTLLFDYILLHEFSLAKAKKLLLAGVGAELVVAVIAAAFCRKRIWAIKHVILSVILPLLLTATVGYYLLLTTFSADTVERVLFFGGSYMFVILPTAAAVALPMWLGTRKRKEGYTTQIQKGH